MGRWGSGLFQSDDAEDLLCDLSEISDNEFLSFIESILDKAITAECDRNSLYGEPWCCEKAPAAAEIVAILARHPPECLFADLFGDLSKLTSGKDIPPIDLVIKAIQAVKVLLKVQTSEQPCAEWFDAADESKWFKNMRNVKSRLIKAKKLIQSFDKD